MEGGARSCSFDLACFWFVPIHARSTSHSLGLCLFTLVCVRSALHAPNLWLATPAMHLHHPPTLNPTHMHFLFCIVPVCTCSSLFAPLCTRLHSGLSGLGSVWWPLFMWALVTCALWCLLFVHSAPWFVCACLSVLFVAPCL